MGLAWFFKDTGTFNSYFKLLPYNGEIAEKSRSVKEVKRFEKEILKSQDGEHISDFLQLIDLRESNKDWILSQLPIYVNKSIPSKYFKNMNSKDLLSPSFLELLNNLYDARNELLKKLGGGN